MSLESIEHRLTPLLPRLGSVNARVKIVCDKDGVVHLDATQSPAVMTFADGPADCTIRISKANLEKLIDGKLDPMVAFAMGRLKVDGSKGVAAKLTGVFG
ncbi:MAG: SCP2 sterol-binding domain-containing protein [Caenispirillum bisanense]|uniref:SCP-2 sterol transfer family protein n=1 Tax=Caenispirillum bisanense TaxID=414052 RepID=A0A286GWN8_9PROT|nr:SCP2 sterol-binding domain-containing protein [Caenispirillum bisanense]MCA1941584.1 SCP2 sterol-binding domain-containing protein [Caenispirillum bisanense]MCA1974604.1 SCP2 sterol-binding domain-containing protein [Caenispirillum sp.]SOD99940.1 SCP-2 sterol transfer family protein [Caenispirillum bisanense]